MGEDKRRDLWASTGKRRQSQVQREDRKLSWSALPPERVFGPLQIQLWVLLLGVEEHLLHLGRWLGDVLGYESLAKRFALLLNGASDLLPMLARRALRELEVEIGRLALQLSLLLLVAHWAAVLHLLHLAAHLPLSPDIAQSSEHFLPVLLGLGLKLMFLLHFLKSKLPKMCSLICPDFQFRV